MKPAQLHSSMKKTFADCLATAKLKNADYADDSDALLNFRECESFGVSLELGIMVRLSDKWSRIKNLLHRPAQVADEKLVDTIDDMINYLAILKAHLQSNDT